MSAVTDEMRAAVGAYLARCVRLDNGCLVNPGITTGHYGEIKWLDRRMAAHRAVLAVTLGEIPSDDLVTRHTCDNKPCAAVEHLRFGPQSLNVHDQYLRGRRTSGWAKGEGRPQAILTEAKVCEMRVLARGGMSLGQIAERFGVGYSPVRMAVRGDSWSHVTAEPPVIGRRNKKPNPSAYRFTRLEDARKVAELCAAGYTLAEAGQQLGVSRSTAWTLLRTAREAVA